MSEQAPRASAISRELDRRKSGRIYLKVPVVVSWKGQGGEADTELAITEEFNSTGGLLTMKRTPPDKTELEVTHQPTGESLEALVVRVEDSHTDGQARIAIHYAAKMGSLWGVTFPSQPV
jgi:hypothetical protein